MLNQAKVNSALAGYHLGNIFPGPLHFPRHEIHSLTVIAIQNLVYDIDGAGEKLEDFPQQELVTLSQLFSHAARILDMLSSENKCRDDDRDALKMSLEGMELNFEDICPELRRALDKFYKEQFKVV